MDKEQQSLIDLFNVLPLQSIMIRRSPLSNKEAQALFKIWNSNKTNSGNFNVPVEVDALQVASLTTKGMLKSIGAGSFQNEIEITPKGKAIIRNIILFSEKSSFDGQDGDFDYEAIHMAVNNNDESVKEAKTASKKLDSDSSCNNWLYRAIWK